MPLNETMVQQPKKLLELVHDQIQLRHYSHRTEESYIHWIKEYIYYFNKKHPAGIIMLDRLFAYAVLRSYSALCSF